MHYESDVIKKRNKRRRIILQQRCNYFEDDRNVKNRFDKNKIDNSKLKLSNIIQIILIHSFKDFKIKYISSLDIV